MSEAQLKSLYKANAHIYQPCPSNTVRTQYLPMVAEVARFLHVALSWRIYPMAWQTELFVAQPRALCNILGSRTNNRPLQPLHGRTVFMGGAASA